MPNLTDEQIAELKEYADDLDAARREGVIEGLERAERIADRLIPTSSTWVRDQLRAEIKRLKAEPPLA